MNTISTEPVILSRSNLRTVSFSIGFQLGSSYESTPGVTKVLTNHLVRNTQKHNEDEFANLVDKYGIELYADSGRTSMSLDVTTPPQHLNKAMEILTESLLEPEFIQDHISKITQRMMGSIQQIKSTPESLLNSYTRWEAGFGSDLITKNPNGNETDLMNISVDNLENLYDELKKSKPFFVAVGVDISPQKFEEAGLDTLLSNFGSSSQSNSIITNANQKFNLKVDNPAIPTSNAYIGLNLRGSDPKGGTYAEDLFRSVVSGGMSARMFREIREERNLSYAPRMSVNKFPSGSFYTAMMDVRPERSIEALETTINLLDGVFKTSIPKDELNRALKAAQRTAVFVSDSSSTYTGFVLNRLMTGQEYDLEKIKEGFHSVSEENWQEQISSMWSPNNVSLAITGDAGDVQNIWQSKIEEAIQ